MQQTSQVFDVKLLPRGGGAKRWSRRSGCGLQTTMQDPDGQVIDALGSKRRDRDAARRFFCPALSTLKVTPNEVVTDAAPVYPRVVDELIPSTWRHVERYENNRIEGDHSRLKYRLRPMRG
jgi:transposase, IS6 family